MICKKGYYNTNTAEIAKAAGVYTCIVYSYFKDKHDILIEGIKRYANNIFYPIIDSTNNIQIDNNNLKNVVHEIVTQFVKNHKLSESAHEEITSMTHSDKEVAAFFHQYELEITKTITNLLIKNNFEQENLQEKVHVIIHLVDDLCHEIVYHKHEELDYDIMTNIVIDNIITILTKN